MKSRLKQAVKQYEVSRNGNREWQPITDGHRVKLPRLTQIISKGFDGSRGTPNRPSVSDSSPHAVSLLRPHAGTSEVRHIAGFRGGVRGGAGGWGSLTDYDRL